jgi:ankyrin repeat protein
MEKNADCGKLPAARQLSFLSSMEGAMNRSLERKYFAESDPVFMKATSTPGTMKRLAGLVLLLALLSWGAAAGADPALDQQVLEAAKSGDLALVKSLLHKGADLNAKDNDGNTVLMAAAFGGNLELVKFLIDKGMDIDAKTPVNSSTVLMSAAAGGNLELVKFFINKGLDIDVKTSDGITGLMCAVGAGNPELVEFLVDKGLDVNAKTDDGTTVLMVAALGGNLRTVTLLVGKGADINAKNSHGRTALSIAKLAAQFAGQTDQEKIVDYLESRGAK